MQIQFNPMSLEEANTLFQALSHWILVQEGISTTSVTDEERLAADQHIANAEALIERAVTL
jgi:hypothetical protein